MMPRVCACTPELTNLWRHESTKLPKLFIGKSLAYLLAAADVLALLQGAP